MNIKLFTAIVFAAVMTVCNTQAQSIVAQDATAEDYIKLLNNVGYQVYSFDISSMEKNKYGFIPVIMKYENGKVTNLLQVFDDFGFVFTNSEPKFVINISQEDECSVRCEYKFDKTCGFDTSFKFKKVKGHYGYKRKPFVIPDEFKTDEFIPLVAISSYWYDKEDKMVRNCDVNEFDKDYLNTATFKYSPLIYVIGVKCKKM